MKRKRRGHKKNAERGDSIKAGRYVEDFSEITQDTSELMKHMIKLGSDISIEDVMKIYNTERSYNNFIKCQKILKGEFISKTLLHSGSKLTKEKSNKNKNQNDGKNPTSIPTELITTVDLEKDKNKELLNKVHMEGPWYVGLILNMDKMYNRKGEKRKKEKNVKSLTIFFITNMQLDDLQNLFDNKTKIPYPSLKTYCGMLFVIYAMTNFDSYETAKRAFVYVKEHTRGPFSRLQSCFVTADIMKKLFCPELEHFITSLSPKENILRAKKKNFTK